MGHRHTCCLLCRCVCFGPKAFPSKASPRRKDKAFLRKAVKAFLRKAYRSPACLMLISLFLLVQSFNVAH